MTTYTLQVVEHGQWSDTEVRDASDENMQRLIDRTVIWDRNWGAKRAWRMVETMDDGKTDVVWRNRMAVKFDDRETVG